MVVQHNITAGNSNRMLGLTTASQAKTTEKLSSGYRINRSADDAAGLAISEKMRRQIRGLTQASNNAQDGISLCQIADGALNEVHDMFNRAEELAVKASNGTLTDIDRSYLNEELTKLKEEIDRVATTSTFNEIHIFSEDGHDPTEAGRIDALSLAREDGSTIEIEFNMVDASGNIIDMAEAAKATGTDTTYANSAMAKFVVKSASDAVKQLYDAYPDLFSNGASDGIKIGLNLAPIDGKGGILASAQIWFSNFSSGATVRSYTLNVDTKDYPIKDFEKATDEQKAELGATIAHEMTHMIMYDTMTNAMFDDSIPDWFVEGSAQTSSGDSGWIDTVIDDPTDGNIKSFLKDPSVRDYGAGYIAAAYLGQLASGQSTVSAENIRNGLNSLMTDMAKNHKSLDQAIKDNANISAKYADLATFENKFFNNADASSVQFVKDLVSARAGGAGSVLQDLSKTTTEMFANPTKTSSNYTIMPGNRKYSNAFGSGAFTYPEKPSGGSRDGGADLDLQVGAEAGQHINVKRFNVTYDALIEYNTMDVSTVEKAQETIDSVKIGNRNVSRIRSYYGAIQNRLEHTVKNLDNVVENTTSAESTIRDTDMAKEMVKFSNNNILTQAGQAMLAQANQSNQGILALLG